MDANGKKRERIERKGREREEREGEGREGDFVADCGCPLRREEP